MKCKLIIMLLIAFPIFAAPWQLQADLFEYFPKEDRAWARGAVLFQWDDYILNADSAQLFFKEEQAELTGATGQGGGLYFKAEKAILEPKATELFGSQLTGCSLPEPEYLLYSKHVQLTGERIYLWGNSFRLFGLPKIPLPSLSFPQNSQLPLPTPQFGNSAARGYWGGIAIPNFLAEDRAGVLKLLASEKKGLICSQDLLLERGPWRSQAAIRWEAGLWGSVLVTNGGWKLEAQRELWRQSAEPLVILPEISYSTEKKVKGLVLGQKFAFGNLKEGEVAQRRLKSESTFEGSWRRAGFNLQAHGLFVASRYQDREMLGLSLAGNVGRSWQLGALTANASMGGSLRQALGETPFKHDAMDVGFDLIYAASLRQGPWQFAVSKKGSLLEQPKMEYSLRHDGHCFYWQLGYNERSGAFDLKIGLR